jgi:hypothetical protein
MQTQMSVTRALVELKQLDAKINNEAMNSVFVVNTRGTGSNEVVADAAKTSLQEQRQKLQGAFDKVDALIERRQKIKSAVVISNATTKVDIAGRTVTVAEAIEMKTSIEQKKIYVGTLRRQLNQVEQFAITNNKQLEDQINKLLETTYGKDKKIATEDFELISKPQIATKQIGILGKVEIEKKIQELTTEIEAVESELDFILSESNAKTVISV